MTQQWFVSAFEVCVHLIHDEKSMKAADLLKPGQQSFTKTCIDSGVFSEIINILGKVTSEFKRENVSKAEESEESDEEL